MCYVCKVWTKSPYHYPPNLCHYQRTCFPIESNHTHPENSTTLIWQWLCEIAGAEATRVRMLIVCPKNKTWYMRAIIRVSKQHVQETAHVHPVLLPAMWFFLGIPCFQTLKVLLCDPDQMDSCTLVNICIVSGTRPSESLIPETNICMHALV